MIDLILLWFRRMLLALCTMGIVFAQSGNTVYFGPDPDTSNYDAQKAQELYRILGSGWGYNYDSLLTDLDRWVNNPFVFRDSVGASVQNRTLWRLTISDTIAPSKPPIRISIHARTHPNEVQSSYVTNEMIEILTGSSELAIQLRENCIINVIPMYNPDGVELGNSRTNANDKDLEREWDKNPMQPETAALKRTFEEYMASDSPVRVALNMHSAGNCQRYFVYHHATGTSPAFAEDQKFFISSIRNYWPEGIQNWDYFISWVNYTPTHYPESWYWLNYQEAVMALTYEDMNCAANGEYDRTALALLSGIRDYLGLESTNIAPHVFEPAKNDPESISSNIYPNPAIVGSRINISVRRIVSNDLQISLYNILGQKIPLPSGNRINTQNGLFNASLNTLASGVYFLSIRSGQTRHIKKLTVLPR